MTKSISHLWDRTESALFVVQHLGSGITYVEVLDQRRQVDLIPIPSSLYANGVTRRK